MRYPSLFVATATKRDLVTGTLLTVTYHPDGSVVTHEGLTGRDLPTDDPGLTCSKWMAHMRRHGYAVEVRDATRDEIEKGRAS